MSFRSILPALAVAALLPAAAGAHPKLVASTPAADATVAAPTRVELRFSERLMPKLSGAAIVMTGMPGMTGHPPMPIGGTTAKVAPDGMTLAVTWKKPLPAGTYRVDWHVVSADTHRITGRTSFSVR